MRLSSRVLLTMTTAFAVFATQANAADARLRESAPHHVGLQFHWDFNVLLTRSDVDLLTSSGGQAVIAAAIKAYVPPVIADVIAYEVARRSEDIGRRAGKGGASVEFTIVSTALSVQPTGYRNWKVGGCENPCTEFFSKK